MAKKDKGKPKAPAKKPATGAGVVDVSKKGRELTELALTAKMETFQFRSLVNGDKLRLVFETSWDRLPDGVMDELKQVTKKIGTLKFTEAEIQETVTPTKGKHLPGQKELPLGVSEIK